MGGVWGPQSCFFRQRVLHACGAYGNQEEGFYLGHFIWRPPSADYCPARDDFVHGERGWKTMGPDAVG